MKALAKKAIVCVFGMVLAIVLVPASALAAASDTTKLTDMHAVGSDYVRTEEDAITDSYGKTYSGNVVRFRTGDDAFVSYDLNGAYKEFSGTIVCSTETGSNDVMSVGIFADGEKVYELKGYTRQKAAEPFVLDVTGVGVLSIKTTDDYSWYTGYLYFVDSIFVKSESASPYPSRASLSDLVIIDYQYSSTSDRLFVDVFGNVHNGYTRLGSASRYGYAVFNLDKRYETLSGCIVTGNDTSSESLIDISFLLDDEEVYREEGITRGSPQIDFELDVADCSVLKIAMSSEMTQVSSHNGIVYVADSVLKAHEHKRGEWAVDKEATCTENGSRSQSCTECGDVLGTEEIPALGHKPDGKWVVEKEPTCREEGQEVQKCTVCGEAAETRPIERLPHTPSDDWKTVKEATCAEEGLRQRVCTACGAVVEEEKIERTEHDFGQWSTKSGSIWNNPIVKERVCSACGYVDHVESRPTPWLKPLAIVSLIAFGGLVAMVAILKRSGLPLEPASMRTLFSKVAPKDTGILEPLGREESEGPGEARQPLDADEPKGGEESKG